MPTPQEALAGFDFTQNVPEGYLVANAMVVFSTINPEGHAGVLICADTGCSTVAQLGIIQGVKYMQTATWTDPDNI